MTFAAETSVSVEKSKAELDTLLQKHGATQRGSGSDDEAGKAVVYFKIAGRHVQLMIPLPKFEAYKQTKDRYGRPKIRTVEQQATAHEQACRTRWRAVVLVVKAKLELIEIGMSTVEREFLADIMLPNGRSVGEWMQPQIEDAYRTGDMPPLLGMGGGR